MSASHPLIGARPLARLQLRLDRVLWPVWLLLVVLIAAVTPSTYDQLYPTPADRVALTAQVSANSSLLALTGPAYDLSTTGGFTAWRILGFLATAAGLAAALSVIRHTRAEEETGRLELLRSGVLGRHTALATALLQVVGWSLLIGAAVAGVLVAVGLPAPGSALLAGEIVVTMWFLAGIAAVVAQLTEHARAARGIVGAVVGGGYLMRAVADSAGIGWLGWATPLGWPHRAQPFAENRAWVALLSVAGAVVTAGLAGALESRRDTGAGMLRPSLGPARGRMRSVGALARRMQQAALVWWVVGIGVFGLVLGSVAPGLADLLDNNPVMAEYLRRLGGVQQLALTFVGALLPILCAVGTLCGVAVLARLDAEEQHARVELVLSTGVSRTQLLVAHLLWAVLGAVLIAATAGLAMVGGYALAGGEESLAGDVLAGALGYAAPMLVVVGVATLGLGWLRRGSWLGWGYAGLVIVLTWVGQLLRLPGVVLDLSAFRHVPRMPGEAFAAGPVLGELGLAAALMLLGLIGYRRRDLG